MTRRNRLILKASQGGPEARQPWDTGTGTPPPPLAVFIPHNRRGYALQLSRTSGVAMSPATTPLPRSAVHFLGRLAVKVVPCARRELRFWENRARQIPDPVLRAQALASLAKKRFHADGGSVYGAFRPDWAGRVVPLIVALQTISDYLDNLCDRCQTFDPDDFRQLHHAMRDAVRPFAPLRPYYLYRGMCDDGGYLSDLVGKCQTTLRTLPGYTAVEPHVVWLVDRYCELQEHKHVHPELRTARLQTWWARYQPLFPDLEWWEFAAACGSTLGVFALFLEAVDPELAATQVVQVTGGYFPWICGLHILLDYLIDLEEDAAEGDFNFVRCYPSLTDAHRRIREFLRRSLAEADRLAHSRLHRYVVLGLVAMYLSDAKARRQADVRPMHSMISEAGAAAWTFFWACRLYRWLCRS
ncbi:MAG: tetraprenyl-beta-curcumene synthase family protein [Alicyclobacillaceae bacterium]|nr:tetraprenyl-beta-curcumene synthase family protein [Alicyclobacillaceae bacterium]